MSTAIILIIILIVGSVIANRIFQRRRRQQHIIQEPRENIYHDDNKNQRVNIDTTEARSSSIISGLPVIQNKLKIIAALATFIFIIIILAESVVIVQAGHRGVVLRCSRK